MKLHYLCPDINTPAGGVKKLYDHVDLLNRHGYAATLVHHVPGFRCTWFSNSTAVSYVSDLQFTKQDFLIIPEVYGPASAQFAPGVRKIIFNQNCYYTFSGYPLERDQHLTPYTNPEVVATLVVSEDSRCYVSQVFPGMRVYRMHVGINGQRFPYERRKRKQLCYMPRKHPEDAQQVLNILKFRGMLRDTNVVPIQNMSEQELVGTLRESLIFMSFGYPEGWPSPPAEAMSCGCVVVGYHGFGGKEYFNPDYCYPIEAADVKTFAATVEQVLRRYDAAPEEILAKGQQASQFMRDQHSPEREEADILAMWQELISLPAP